jgi:shikimate dehydrogenase
MFRSAAIFGQPVLHSRSPFIHGTWLHEHKISGAYLRQEVSAEVLPALLKEFHKTGLTGANLTSPLKEMACAHVEMDEVAAKLQAVNTIWLENGKLRGTNTDAAGFTAACDEQVPDWRNSLSYVVVLGAGGAAKAVVHALLQAGAEHIALVNRNEARARNLAALFGTKLESQGWNRLIDVLPQTSMLVNATSLGMSGQPALEFDLKKIKKNAMIADIVYAPLETKLLKEARMAGHKTVDGLSMLLHQAVPAFERWFGVRPKVTEELRQAAANDLKAGA